MELDAIVMFLAPIDKKLLLLSHDTNDRLPLLVASTDRQSVSDRTL